MSVRCLVVTALLIAALQAAADPPTFEKIGAFVGRGGAMSRLVAPGPNGSERLYICYTYLSSLDLVAYDRAGGPPQVWRHDEGGAWAMETGPDGRLYVGTYFQGHILRLNPQTGKLDDLGQAIAGETYVWQLSRGPDGKLYGCTYPGCKLLQVDTATGKCADLGKMNPTEQYNRTVVAAPDGWVYCATGSQRQGLAAYHPATRELRDLTPPGEPVPGFGQVYRGTDGHAWGTAAGKTWRLRDGAATVVAEAPAAASRTRWADGTEAREPASYAGRDLPLFRVAEGPDGAVYGSSILPEYLLRYAPSDAKRTTLGLIPGAEAYSMLTAHGRLFIASYTGATLQVYDPARPFDPGTARANNPAYYGQTAPHQDRPYDIALGADGRVFIACVPAYGYHGGAISWYDPATDTVSNVPSPVPDQAIASVVALNDGGLVFGTSIEGGPGTKPRATQAVVFGWDPATRSKTWEVAPVEGAASVGNLAVGGDGLVYGSAAGQVFALDPRTHAVVGRTKLAQGGVARAGMLTLANGTVVVLAGPSAVTVRYARGRWTVRELARHTAPLTAGKAVVDGWLYAAADRDLVRCRVPRSR